MQHIKLAIERMRHKLWDLFWYIPHSVRALPCVLLRKHIGKSWFGIKTIRNNGGFCSICGTGALAKPHL